MPLFDDLLTNGVPVKKGPRCRVMVVLDKLPDEDKGGFGEALAQAPEDLPSTAIAEVLTANGHRISAQSIQRHRRGGCQCAELT